MKVWDPPPKDMDKDLGGSAGEDGKDSDPSKELASNNNWIFFKVWSKFLSVKNVQSPS